MEATEVLAAYRQLPNLLNKMGRIIFWCQKVGDGVVDNFLYMETLSTTPFP